MEPRGGFLLLVSTHRRGPASYLWRFTFLWQITLLEKQWRNFWDCFKIPEICLFFKIIGLILHPSTLLPSLLSSAQFPAAAAKNASSSCTGPSPCSRQLVWWTQRRIVSNKQKKKQTSISIESWWKGKTRYGEGEYWTYMSGGKGEQRERDDCVVLCLQDV